MRKISTFFASMIMVAVAMVPNIAIAWDGGWKIGNSCAINPQWFGLDNYYFCGQQDTVCYNDKAERSEVNQTTHWYYNKQSAMLDGSKYYCCGGTTSKAGTFVKADNWIDKEKTKRVDKKVAGGTCTYYLRYNVCDPTTHDTDESDPECTTATGTCDDGYTSRNGRCAKICDDGYAFESETSNTCVKCDNADIKQGICQPCEAGQIRNKTTLNCVSINDYEQVTTTAHDTCWMCITPAIMLDCLKHVSNGGSINSSEYLKSGCSLDSTSEKLVNKPGWQPAGNVSPKAPITTPTTPSAGTDRITETPTGSTSGTSSSGGTTNNGNSGSSSNSGNNNTNTGSNTSTSGNTSGTSGGNSGTGGGSTSGSTTSGGSGGGGGGRRNDLLPGAVIDDGAGGFNKFNVQQKTLNFQ